MENKTNKPEMLVQYVRIRKGSKRGFPRGVVVALSPNRVGWSFTNLKSGDRFDKKLGLALAHYRAMHPSQTPKMPYDVTPIFQKMSERAKKYFKVGPPSMRA